MQFKFRHEVGYNADTESVGDNMPTTHGDHNGASAHDGNAADCIAEVGCNSAKSRAMLALRKCMQFRGHAVGYNADPTAIGDYMPTRHGYNNGASSCDGNAVDCDAEVGRNSAKSLAMLQLNKCKQFKFRHAVGYNAIHNANRDGADTEAFGDNFGSTSADGNADGSKADRTQVPSARYMCPTRPVFRDNSDIWDPENPHLGGQARHDRSQQMLDETFVWIAAMRKWADD